MDEENVEVYQEPKPKVTHRYHEAKGFIYGLPARNLTDQDVYSPADLQRGLDSGVYTEIAPKKAEDKK